MSYWFVFCRGDVLLERRADGTHTIPSGEKPPVCVAADAHILNVSPMDDGTAVKALAIAEAPNDPRYEMCGLRQSFYKLSLPLYLKAGKAQELLYWDRNTRFCGVCGSPMKMDTDISKRCPNCGKTV